VLTLRRLPNRTLLVWQRGGNLSALEGFWLYVDGNRVDRLPPEQSVQDITKYAPACGETREFHLTAFRGHSFDSDGESLSSNPATWQGEPCSSETLPSEAAGDAQD
jgi:hypothetical protein